MVPVPVIETKDTFQDKQVEFETGITAQKNNCLQMVSSWFDTYKMTDHRGVTTRTHRRMHAPDFESGASAVTIKLLMI